MIVLCGRHSTHHNSDHGSNALTVEADEQPRKKTWKEECTARRKAIKQQKAELKRKNARLGGVVWGWDPQAGLLQPAQQDSRNISTDLTADHPRHDEMDLLGRRTGHSYKGRSKFGIEHGGPGKEGTFAHGSIQNLRRKSQIAFRRGKTIVKTVFGKDAEAGLKQPPAE